MMASQAMHFFAAGFETTSSTTVSILYELAMNPDIQEKLRKEILMYSGKSQEITYDMLEEMKYLNMCVLGKYQIITIK